MTDAGANLGLDLVRQALSRYTDTPVDQIHPETLLADINVDSLTLAELLFELEDRLKVTMAEPTEPPQTIADLLVLVRPYLEADGTPKQP